MNPMIHLGTAHVPGGVEIRLYKRGEEFMILLPTDELMSSRMRASEERLATMTLERLGEHPAPRMLIGGYGMGFTLRAALAAAPQRARITVAELLPEIVDWARGPMAELTAGCLDDPRVTHEVRDVAETIAFDVGHFDAILLDVDNGPDGVVRKENDRLYSRGGLATTFGALRPGGVLAVWSAADDAGFTRRLRGAGFEVEMVTVKARPNGKGPRHVIWFARRPS